MIELKCVVTTDKQIGILNKTKDGLKAYVVTKSTLISILHNTYNKKKIFDPLLDQQPTLKPFGIFSIFATKRTMKKIIKMLEPYKAK